MLKKASFFAALFFVLLSQVHAKQLTVTVLDKHNRPVADAPIYVTYQKKSLTMNPPRGGLIPIVSRQYVDGHSVMYITDGNGKLRFEAKVPFSYSEPRITLKVQVVAYQRWDRRYEEMLLVEPVGHDGYYKSDGFFLKEQQYPGITGTFRLEELPSKLTFITKHATAEEVERQVQEAVNNFRQKEGVTSIPGYSK
jgi:hypothetical protein